MPLAPSTLTLKLGGGGGGAGGHSWTKYLEAFHVLA